MGGRRTAPSLPTGLVSGSGVIVLGLRGITDCELVEVDHVDHESGIGRSLGGAADEDMHALDVGPGEEELDAM